MTEPKRPDLWTGDLFAPLAVVPEVMTEARVTKDRTPNTVPKAVSDDVTLRDDWSHNFFVYQEHIELIENPLLRGVG